VLHHSFIISTRRLLKTNLHNDKYFLQRLKALNLCSGSLSYIQCKAHSDPQVLNSFTFSSRGKEFNNRSTYHFMYLDLMRKKSLCSTLQLPIMPGSTLPRFLIVCVLLCLQCTVLRRDLFTHRQYSPSLFFALRLNQSCRHLYDRFVLRHQHLVCFIHTAVSLLFYVHDIGIICIRNSSHWLYFQSGDIFLSNVHEK